MARPLPRIVVTWQESTVPEDQFLAYRVWRRVRGESTWTLVAELATRARTQWDDYTARSRVVYQYTVTQRALYGLDEVESELAPPVEAQLVVRSVFIHVVGDESRYVELQPTSQQVAEERRVETRRVWGRRDPVPVISPGREIAVSLRGSEMWGADGGIWDGLTALMDAQEAGARLWARQDRWSGPCVILSRSREDGAVLYDWELRLALVDDGGAA